MSTLKTTVVELSNINNIGAEYNVKLPRPIHIKNNSIISVTDAYISLFSGEIYSANSIVIEQDYTFTMKAVLIFTNLCDSIETAHGTTLPMGYTSIAMNGNGEMEIINIDIKIPKGVYQPNDIVQLFNKQSCRPEYINYYSILNGGFTLPAIGGVAPANIVKFSTTDGVTISSGDTVEFSQPTLGGWNPEYGFEVVPQDDPTEYSCPPASCFLHGSVVGLEIDFDEIENKFFISRNFSPIVSGDSNQISILRYQPSNLPPTNLTRTYFDRCGEIFITDWGWSISNFGESFWSRLGFTATDLYKSEDYTSDTFLWGRTYANYNPLTNLMVNDTYSSESLRALKIQQGFENGDSWAAVTYDGSTIGIYASEQPIYNPLPYLRARISLSAAGGFLSPDGDLGIVQLISLLNLSPTSTTSFGILNANPFGVDGNILISEITVRFEDPRTNAPLDWISKKIFSSITLRIQEMD